MARIVFRGEPGDVFTNETGKLLFQFRVSGSNTCGLCWSYNLAVGPMWPIPLHRNCACVSVPVPPGESAAPYSDMMEDIRDLDPHQQTAVMGRANWQMVESN